MIDTTFETKEQGLEKLKETVSIRNKMGGALYWNIVNDVCLEIANKLFAMGVPRSEIQEILDN
ncbi:MAG: hypothetical protein UHD64_05690 [Bacteroidales bacterium]|nr:hypothetical protein [Bacteroidales bacterium]